MWAAGPATVFQNASAPGHRMHPRQKYHRLYHARHKQAVWCKPNSTANRLKCAWKETRSHGPPASIRGVKTAPRRAMNWRIEKASAVERQARHLTRSSPTSAGCFAYEETSSLRQSRHLNLVRVAGVNHPGWLRLRHRRRCGRDGSGPWPAAQPSTTTISCRKVRSIRNGCACPNALNCLRPMGPMNKIVCRCGEV